MDPDTELRLISIVAKTLCRHVPGIPMDVATRYAKFIVRDLDDAGYLLSIGGDT